MQTMIANINVTNRNDGYTEFRQTQELYYKAVMNNATHLFQTNAEGLWEAFINNLPAESRQHYNCRNCKAFVERYGGLVAVGSHGQTIPVMWPQAESVPLRFQASVRALHRLVTGARITSPFYSDERTWGTARNTPEGGPYKGLTWTHIHVTPDLKFMRQSLRQTADQDMAVKREEYGMLQRGLAEYNENTARTALHLLESGTLFRADKCIEVAKWLVSLYEKTARYKGGRNRDNLLWLAVAGAPAGWCHVRSGMIGTLLDDIQNGLDVPTIKQRFDEKMNPTKYQRPTAPPSVGTITQATKLFEERGAAASLRRRFAKMSDMQSVWRPGEELATVVASHGLFGHLLPTAPPSPTVTAPETTMTWRKFYETIIQPGIAHKIEFYVPASGSFCGVLTAVDMSAPPILQWDLPEARNPVSWYLYHNPMSLSRGSSADRWGLKPYSWVPVTAISLQPNMWAAEPRFLNQGQGIIFSLQGAIDKGVEGLALFPETLKSEFHGVRAVIEAYSGRAKPEGINEAEANGIILQRTEMSGANWLAKFRVTDSHGQVRTILLDRWD